MSDTKWTSCMPESADERTADERSDNRNAIMADATTRLDTTQLPPLIWAFLQVADLDRLQSITADELSWMSSAKADPNEDVGFAKQLDASAQTTISLWLQGRRHDLKLAKITSSRQSPEVARLCEERDGEKCVVSGIGEVDACHLYPLCVFSQTDPERVKRFWGTLRMFFSKDKVDRWHKIIFGDADSRGTETVANMIAFDTTLHLFHSKGAFALRPIRMSEDRRKMELELHYLPQVKRESTSKVDLMETPPLWKDHKRQNFRLSRFGEQDAPPTEIHNRALIVMETDDPVKKPLPDPGLLELQWHLQRVLSISGAAGWRDEDFDEDSDMKNALDDDDGPNPENTVASVNEWLDGLVEEQNTTSQ